MQVDTAAIAQQMHRTAKLWMEEKARLLAARVGTSDETRFLYESACGGAAAASRFATFMLDDCLPEPPVLSDEWRMPRELQPSVEALEEVEAWVFIIDYFAILNGLYQFIVYETDQFIDLWNRYVYALDWLGHPALDLAEFAPELLGKDNQKSFWLREGGALMEALITVRELSEADRARIADEMDPERTGPRGPMGWLASRSATAILQLDAEVRLPPDYGTNQ